MKTRIRMIARKPISLDYFQTTFDRTEGEEGFGKTITVERKAWQCVLCKKWQEYWTVQMGDNEHIVRGCGGSSQFYEGHRIDHCCSFVCSRKADALMGITNPTAPLKPKRRAAGRGKKR